MYSINFTKKNTKFCLSLHYNGTNSYLFVNGTDIIKFKAKNSEILAYSLRLGNISKNWTNDNMKKTGLTVTFLILAVIITLLQFLIHKIFTNI